MADSRYVLMHKNTPVADLQLDTDTGVIRSVALFITRSMFGRYPCEKGSH